MGSPHSVVDRKTFEQPTHFPTDQFLNLPGDDGKLCQKQRPRESVRSVRIMEAVAGTVRFPFEVGNGHVVASTAGERGRELNSYFGISKNPRVFRGRGFPRL